MVQQQISKITATVAVAMNGFGMANALTLEGIKRRDQDGNLIPRNQQPVPEPTAPTPQAQEDVELKQDVDEPQEPSPQEPYRYQQPKYKYDLIWTENGYLDRNHQSGQFEKYNKKFEDFTAAEVVQFFRENGMVFVSRALEFTNEERLLEIVDRFDGRLASQRYKIDNNYAPIRDMNGKQVLRCLRSPRQFQGRSFFSYVLEYQFRYLYRNFYELVPNVRRHQQQEGMLDLQQQYQQWRQEQEKRQAGAVSFEIQRQEGLRDTIPQYRTYTAIEVEVEKLIEAYEHRTNNSLLGLKLRDIGVPRNELNSWSVL